MPFPAFPSPVVNLRTTSDPTAPLPVLRAAVFERLLAHLGTADHYYPYFVSGVEPLDDWPQLPAAGEVLRIGDALATMQLAVGRMIEYHNYRSNPYLLSMPCWVDHRQPIAGQLRPTFWTMASLRAAAGLPATKLYYRRDTGYLGGPIDGPALFDADGAGYGGQWRDGGFLRRAERWHSGPADWGYDTQGNPIAAGMYARRGAGFVHRYDGGGVWTRDDSHAPDLLSNANDPPHCVTGSPSPHITGDDFGQVRTGDIVGGSLGRHLYDELRAVLNLMRWTARSSTIDDGFLSVELEPFGYEERRLQLLPIYEEPNSYTRIAIYPTFADVVAGMAAQWAATPLEVAPGGNHAFADAYVSYYPARPEDTIPTLYPQAYGYTARRARVRYRAADLPTTIARAVDWYTPSNWSVYTNPDTSYSAWEGSGDVAGPVEVLELWGQTGPEATAASESPYLGRVDVPPTALPPPMHPTYNTTASSGYATRTLTSDGKVIGPLAVLRWDVPGGFVHID